jgi:hypothetical protein
MEHLTSVSRSAAMLLAVLAMFWLAGCGGGGATTTGLTSGAVNSASDVRALAAGAAVPALPADTLAASSARGASDVGAQEYTGSGAALVNYSGGEVQGDSLVLTSTADTIAWALYHVSGLDGLHVSQFGISMQFSAEGSKAGLGVSNYSGGVWKWLTYTDQAETTIDLSRNQHRLISLLGNLYWVVVVPAGGASVTVDKASLLIDDAEGWLPGMGNYMFASKGLPGEIDLEWGISAGATSYEIYRREATQPGCHGGGAENSAQFALLATAGTNTYIDTAVTPAVWYEYKVCPLNEEGAGDFGHPALGVASDPSGASWDYSGWGKISAITAGGITLEMPRGSCYWTLNAGTLYFAADGTAATADHFAAGMFVFVGGQFSDPTAPPVALTVTEVTERGQHNPVAHDASACGVVAEIGAEALVLTPDWPKAAEDLTYVLNADTTYFDRDGNPVEAAYITVGMRVQVRADFDADGQRIATAVIEAREGRIGGGGDQPALPAGAITALDETSITITDDAGVAFTAALNPQTQWLGLDGAALDATQFALGELVVILAAPGHGAPVALAVHKYDGVNLPAFPAPPPPNGGNPPGGENLP